MATIRAFRVAMESWNENLTTMYDAEPARDERGGVVLTRTKHFVDCTLERGGERFMLSMSLDEESLMCAKRVAVRLRRAQSPCLCVYDVLPGELSVVAAGAERTVDVVRHKLPSGRVLSDAIDSVDIAQLYCAVGELYQEFERMDIVHSNLRGDNIIITDDGHLVPLRYEYVVPFTEAEAALDFDRLCSWIEQVSGIERPLELYRRASNDAKSEPTLERYEWRSNYFEGICLVRNAEGYGYVDEEGIERIAPQFIWANDFHEGRAEVKCATGMGLIDTRGYYIIEPQFEIVEYDHSENIILVRQNGSWSRYDYNGLLIP